MEETIEDSFITLDEENALVQHLDRFGLTAADTSAKGAHTSLVQATIILDVAQGIKPQHQNIQGQAPLNLMKSEQPVPLVNGVD